MKGFLKDVYDFVRILESYEKAVESEKKRVQQEIDRRKNKKTGGNEMELANNGETRESAMDKPKTLANVHGIKEFMCPLGEKCPDYLGPRWPTTDTRTFLPFGAKCPLAHHTSELRFAQEEKVKTKMLKDLKKALDKKLGNEGSKDVFMPGGNSIKGCFGCGKCSYCNFSRFNKGKESEFKKKADKKFEEMKKEEGVKNKQERLKEADESLRKKLGFFRKATILFEIERYNECYDNIKEAVKIIREEKHKEKIEKGNRDEKLKEKLKLDPDVNIAPEMFTKFFLKPGQRGLPLESGAEGIDTSNGLDSSQKIQKKLVFAQKTGIIGQQDYDVNEFVNIQVKDLYDKVTKKIEDQVKDVIEIKRKIENLEELEEARGENQDLALDLAAKMDLKKDGVPNPSKIRRVRLRIQKDKMCDSCFQRRACTCPSKFGCNCPQFIFREKCKNPTCLMAHNPTELDIVPTEKKVQNLQDAFRYLSVKMEEGKPPVPFNPSGNVDFTFLVAKDSPFGISMKELKKKKKKKEKKDDDGEIKRQKPDVHGPFEMDTEDLNTNPMRRVKKNPVAAF